MQQLLRDHAAADNDLAKIVRGSESTLSKFTNDPTWLDPKQYQADMAELQSKLSLLDKVEENKPRQEGCSCLYGNPCQDPYVCLDWDNRWKVSIDNGLSKEEIKRAGFAAA